MISISDGPDAAPNFRISDLINTIKTQLAFC